MSGRAPALVEIGFVARAHGVRGELRVAVHNPGSQVLALAETVYVAGRPCRVRAARQVADGWLLAVDEIRDRDRAHELRGAAVAVPRDALDLDAGDVLLCDLVGCDVALPDGTPWGRIEAVEVGPQDRLVIHHGDVERLLPVAGPLILDIDLEARRVTVSPPEGLPEQRLSGRGHARPERPGAGDPGPDRPGPRGRRGPGGE